MSWTDRPRDPADFADEATVMLPVVPTGSEPTVVIPAVNPYGPPPGYARAPYDADRTEVLAPVRDQYPQVRDGGPVDAAATAPVTEAAGDQPSVAKSSAIMAAGSLVSRITGLLRTIAIAAAIGGIGVGDAYGLANNLPNMVYELLLGGVLGSVLVPYLTRARLNDPDRGEAYAQRLMTLALSFLAGATVIAVIAAPLLTKLFAITQRSNADADQLHLTTMLGYLILPEIIFYGFAALAAAILNTRGHFAAPTWTPILNNIVVIATAGVFIALPSASSLTAKNISSAQVLVLGIGTTLGIVIQALGLLPALRKVGFRFKARFDFRQLQLRELGRASGWMLAYVLATECALVVGLIIMYAASAESAPAIAIYSNAYLIFMMAHGICAVSIMVALMPRLSAAAAEGRLADLARQMASGTRLSAVILIPITAAYLTLGQPLSITLFAWHSYTLDEASKTGTVIALAGIGLVPYAISQMQLFAFYALREQKTAGLISFPVAGVRILLNLIFYTVLPIAAVTASLMVANTISYLVAMVIGYVILRKKVGLLGLTEMGMALARLAVAAIIAAIPTYLLVLLFEHIMGTGKVSSIVTLIIGGIVLIGVYIGAALALKAKDVTDVAAMVKSRLGR
jgi:putative peptidoglycan lipid II flippase